MSAQDECDKTQEVSKEAEPNVQVQSANSWETADLGDKERNEKFLRLMGATKKEHHGKIVIGDHKPAHKRERKEDQQITDGLAEQYEHSMEYRLAGGRRGHLGLGYHPEPPEEKKNLDTVDTVEEKGVEAKGEEGEEADEVPETEDTMSNNVEKEGDDSHKDGGDNTSENERKRKSLDSVSESDEKKMKFTKGSS